MSDFIDQAKHALQSKEGSPEALFTLAQGLKGEQKFDLARRVLALALDPKRPAPESMLRRRIVQQLANCTEKDPDLPLDRRYVRAREILAPELAEAETYLRQPPAEADEPSRKSIKAHQETFGIAGAIHKRWWQADAQVRHLMEAQDLYEKGWRLAESFRGAGLPDQGYTGINAAFVLDLLGQQTLDDRKLRAAQTRRARKIRRAIRERLSVLPPEELKDWWTLVTLAEACFGLRNYRQASDWLARTAMIEEAPQRWEYETTARQLARLAMMPRGRKHVAGEVIERGAVEALRTFLKGDEAALRTAFRGKVGLALSGGGFRASLFHIGILARLAELDMLRHVEVISCVSGGSIIGALYYLKLRELLESKVEAKIERQDYLDLVASMEKDFMEAIQGNPRMQVFSRLARLGQRTELMGELLDAALYSKAAGFTERPSLGALKIRPPATEDEERIERTQRSPFVPKYDNWRRAHKVPILIINATTLNTGHNWQFTAAFMGESPNHIVPEVDGNERLRRMYFDERDAVPDGYRDFPLGRAVAASAAVPGLFRPVRLSGLYPGRDVELVDGGVHDNQGVAGLREQDCTVLLVSDACGQLVAETHPSRLETAVLTRANGTLMARVRELEYRELVARQQAGLLREFLFVHLKKQLNVEPVDWIGCDLEKDSSDQEGVPPDSDQVTSYDVRGDVQNLLSGIRTDLDAFSEAEAFALMASGYLMTKWDFPRSIRSFGSAEVKEGRWRFLAVRALVKAPADAADFLRSLRLAGSLLFKAPKLWLQGWRFGWSTCLRLLAVLAGTGLALLSVALWLAALEPWGLRLAVLLLLGAALVVALACGALYPLTRWLDRHYLDRGALKNLLPAETKNGDRP